MKIAYSISEDDYVAFNVFHNTHSAFWRRRQVIAGLVVPIATLIIVCGLSYSSGDWGAVPICAVILGLLSLWILAGGRRRAKKTARRMLREGENRSLLGERELEISDAGLTIQTPLRESRIAWQAIERVAVTPDYCLVYIGAIEALIVPRRKILPEDFESLMREIEEGFRGAASIDGRTFNEKKIVRDAKPIFKGDPSKKGHCCGVVSLVGGVVAGALYGLVMGLMFAAAAGGQAEESVGSPPSGGYLIMAAIVANLLGTGYGIAGLINRRQEKLLPIIGLVINGGVLFVIAILVMIGMILGG